MNPKRKLFTIALAVSIPSASANIQCVTSFSRSSTILETIASDRINDGYCDCPHTGMDEPDTDACSGHVQWSGKVWSSDEHERPHTSTSILQSSCPQQPNLLLPFSHRNDGICDCCDGTDEPPGLCSDVCDEVLKYERDAQLKKQHDFNTGYQRRQHALAEFTQLKDETDEAIHRLEYTERPVLETKNEGLTTQIIQLSMDANASYRKLLTGLVGPKKSMEFVNVLTLAELSELIVAVCHLTGEAYSTGATQREDCLDLKDAASDVGYGWNDNLLTAHALRTADDYARFWFGDGTEEQNSNQKKKNKNKFKNKNKNKNKSPSMDTIVVEETPHVPRLSFLSHAKNVMVEHLQPLIDEGKTTDADDKDDQLDDDDDDHEHRHDMNDDDDKDDDDDMGRNDDDDDLDRDFDEYVDDPVEAPEEEPVSVEEEPEPEQPAIDPLALQMVYNNFQDSITKIQNGVKVGKSARLMMDSFRELTEPDTKEVTVGPPAYTNPSELRDDLALIAAELLILSNIQQEDLLEILYSILPEAQADTYLQNNPDECQADDVNDDVNKECAAHSFKSNCVMSGPYIRNNIQIPPFNTVIKRHLRCQKRLKSPPVVTYLPGLDIEIPASIPDGYMEYYQFQPRVEGNDFDNQQSFAALLNKKETTQTTINTLQGMMRENLALLNDVQIQIDGLHTQIGGTPNIYGQDGILHSLKGNCVSLETGGKYVYELCPFAKAHQRDIGQKLPGGGTYLGTWHGFEQSNHRPALVFKDGDKCWNGPKRSAWIFPICGPETKLISADEPETCKYEFVMETPIACDEIYARDHGLVLE